MNNTVQAVLFDAVGTLIYLPQSVGQHYHEVAGRFGFDVASDALDRSFKAAWKASPPRIPEAGPRPHDDKDWWRDLVGRVLEQTLPETARASFPEAEYFEAVYAHFAEPGVWASFPEVEEVLTDLRRRGLKLGVVSNFDRRLRAVLSHLGLLRHFNAVVISSEVGVDKPDPLIFQHALAALKVSAVDTVHVGDDPRCDWGAVAAHLRVYELRRPETSLRDAFTWIARGSTAG